MYSKITYPNLRYKITNHNHITSINSYKQYYLVLTTNYDLQNTKENNPIIDVTIP